MNFRAALSLVAEAIVGDWSDFVGFREPCEWVHEQVGLVKGPDSRSRDAFRATLLLSSRLTANAIFPDMGSTASLEGIRDEAADKGCVLTSWLAAELARRSSLGGSALREATFPRVITPLDPARWSPDSDTNPLRVVEDEFCQGVSEGLHEFGSQLNQLESRLMAWVEASEDEWAQLPVSDVVAARRLRRFLRGLAATLVKRSIGARDGHHLNETYLREYQDGLRSQNLLNQIRQPLQQVLGVRNFRFGMMDSFGRALSSEGDAIALEAHAARLSLRTAPVTSFGAPAHDSPVLFVDDHGMALTFEVYLALRLQGAGCANSSLPPSVRASLDRVRHLRAGQACRNYSDLSGGTSRIHIGALGAIEAEPGTLLPVFNRVTS